MLKDQAQFLQALHRLVADVAAVAETAVAAALAQTHKLALPLRALTAATVVAAVAVAVAPEPTVLLLAALTAALVVLVFQTI